MGPKSKFFLTRGRRPKNALRLVIARYTEARPISSVLAMASGPMPRQQSAPWRFDSLGDLNFMEEHLMVVWTIRQIGCWIIGG